MSPKEIAREKQSLLAANVKGLPSDAALGRKNSLDYTFYNLIHLFRMSHLVNERPQHVCLFIFYFIFLFFFPSVSSSVRFLMVNVLEENGVVHPLSLCRAQ